jgi:hypothetical protein
MHPKNRMEKAVALEAIADAAEKMEQSGASSMDVSAFVSGARQKQLLVRTNGPSQTSNNRR